MTALSGADKSLNPTEQRVDTRSFSQGYEGDDGFIPNSDLMTEALWSLTTASEDRLIRDYMYQLTSNDKTKAIAVLTRHFPSGVRERIEMLRNNMISENPKASEDEIAAQSDNLIQELACQALLIYEAKPANEHQIVEEL